MRPAIGWQGETIVTEFELCGGTMVPFGFAERLSIFDQIAIGKTIWEPLWLSWLQAQLLGYRDALHLLGSHWSPYELRGAVLARSSPLRRWLLLTRAALQDSAWEAFSTIFTHGGLLLLHYLRHYPSGHPQAGTNGRFGCGRLLYLSQKMTLL